MDERGIASESPEMEHDSDDKMEPDSEDSEGIQNMFASVWVKVEVNDDKEQDSDHLANTEEMEESQNISGIHCKKFLCDHCEYRTSFKTCMKRHALGHLDIKPYVCGQCPFAAMYPGALQRHKIKHQIDNGDERAKKYFCDSCEYSTYFKYSLRAHKRKHSLEKTYQCSECTYSTAYRGSFVKHLKIHKNEPKQYKCDKCPFVTKHPGHIYRHRAKIHRLVTGDAKVCSYCDFSTVIRWRLNQHIARSKQDKLIQCKQCDFETYYMCQSRQHKSEHQKAYGQTVEKEVNKIIVEMQNQSEVTEVNEDPIEQNTNIVDSAKIANLTTDIIQLINNTTNANDGNDTNDNLSETEGVIETKNIKVLQSGDSSKPYQCSKCSYSSKLKAPVQRHFRRHHTSHNRPYKCTNCDFSTKTRDNLLLHTKRSKSELMLDCNSCTFSTQFKCTLVLHQKEHNAHKCTLCSYSSRNRHEIQRHFNVVHLNGGTKCRFCDFKSARKESVLCHETIHTGDKPFKCKLCDYKTVRNSLLTIHFRKHHSDSDCF